MVIKNVTITSKNQITLPSEYVRLLALTQNRVLSAYLEDGKIVLAPQPDLADTMQRFWGKHHAKQALTESQIAESTRSIAAVKASKQ